VIGRKPARTAERQRLADAVGRHRNAVEALDRVTAALGRLEREYYDETVPAAVAAKAALEEARQAAPAALVSRYLGDGDPGDAPSVTEAERRLAEAEREIAEARTARGMLADEAQRAQAAVDLARMALDGAIKAVVSASPELSALRAEFERARKRMSVLIGALAGAGVTTSRVAWTDDAFVPPAEWTAAVAALRDDPDAVLPGLPDDPEPDHADGHRGQAAAA
jgi:hypothetical protein